MIKTIGPSVPVSIMSGTLSRKPPMIPQDDAAASKKQKLEARLAALSCFAFKWIQFQIEFLCQIARSNLFTDRPD